MCEKIYYPILKEVKILDITERGVRGFGSTGKKIKNCSFYWLFSDESESILSYNCIWKNNSDKYSGGE